MRDADADVVATDIVLSDRGAEFTLVDRRAGGSERIVSPLLGDFNVANAVAAAATARAAGFALEAIGAGLRAAHPVPGRVERIDAGQPFTVLVDYAHSPGEVTAVLQVARSLAAPSGRVIVAFGCGGDRDPSKRPLMGAAAGAGADLAIVTSDNPRHEDPQAIVDAVLPGLPSAAGAEVSGAARPADRDRRRAAGRARRRRRRDRGQGRGDRADHRRHRGAVRRPSRRARGARGARMELTAREIAEITGSSSVVGDAFARARSWSNDTRALAPGACFVALVDARDGHEFVGDAFARGATIALVTRDVAGLRLRRVPRS